MATSLRPFADAASAITPRLNELLDCVQVAPELVEKMMVPTLLPATSRVPSAEQTMRCKSATGAVFVAHVAPSLVER